MNIPSKPGPIYSLYLHVPTGERYAFRVEAGRVTGCLGPRNLAQWRTTDLTGLDYDSNLQLAEWAHDHWGEFDLTS